MTLLVIYCVVAISFSFLCSILESTFLSTTPSFVKSYAKKHPKIGAYLQYQKSHIDDTEGAILVLNTFSVTGSATGFGIEINALYGEQYQFLASSIFAVALIYLTEILPKTIGATYWQNLAPFVAVFNHYLLKITKPFVFIAKIIIKFISFGHKGKITRDEVLAASELGKDGGCINEKEMKLLTNLLSLKNYQTADILTPRSVVFSLKHDDKIEEIVKSKHIFTFSRAPVFAGETIIGIVETAEILNQALCDKSRQMAEFIRPVFIVPYNLNALNLLRLFIQKNERFFVVVDRYGQFFGVVTFEDVIETLLGEEIMDEFDKVSDMQKLAKERAKKFQKNYIDRLNFEN